MFARGGLLLSGSKRGCGCTFTACVAGHIQLAILPGVATGHKREDTCGEDSRVLHAARIGNSITFRYMAIIVSRQKVVHNLNT